MVCGYPLCIYVGIKYVGIEGTTHLKRSVLIFLDAFLQVLLEKDRRPDASQLTMQGNNRERDSGPKIEPQSNVI